MNKLILAKTFFFAWSAFDLSTFLMVGCILGSGGLYFYRKKEAEAKYKEHNKNLNQ